MKNQKFPPLDEDFGDEGSYDSGMDERSSVEDEPKIISRQQLAEMQRISPDALHTPQKGRSGHSTDDDEESPPAESLKRKFDDDEANKSSKRRVNPFAKKRLEFPSKGDYEAASIACEANFVKGEITSKCASWRPGDRLVHYEYSANSLGM
eukprot:scaffold19027_cov75-Skeletonema_marinoi.AAC.1